MSRAGSIWNLKCLNGPPLVTFEYSLAEYEFLFATTNYHIMFEQHSNRLMCLLSTSRSTFETEKSLLEKVIYKNWNALRKEKAMQSMRRLKKVLTSFEAIKLTNLISSMKDLTCTTGRSLPSREYLEYFLVRLYAAFKLSEFALTLITQQIFFNLVKSIQMAVFLPNNILFLSIVARIFCLVKKYKESIVFVYNSLRESVGLFKSTSIKWHQEFHVDQLPLNISNSDNSTNDQNISELANKLSETNNNNNKIEERITEIQNLNLQDMGVRIERTIEKEPTAEQPSATNNELVWKKDLIKCAKKLMKSLDTCDCASLIKFRKQFKKCLNKKILLHGETYSGFVKKFVGTKKLVKKNFAPLIENNNKILLKHVEKVVKQILK